jgi:AcrR family transcriptional regulator
MRDLLTDTLDNKVRGTVVKTANKCVRSSPPMRGKRRARPRKRRVRRDPAAAHELILAAAEHLFADRGPDAVGLKDVARAAGVSHALVSHYFGTYEQLVATALERRLALVRERVFAKLLDTQSEPGASELLERLWAALDDPTTLRLTAWALLTRRADDPRFLPTPDQAPLRVIADAIEQRLASRKRGRSRRGDVEFTIVAALTMSYGYALLGPALRAALGTPSSTAARDDFRTRVVAMLEAYLRISE